MYSAGPTRAVSIVLALPVAQYLTSSLTHAAFIDSYVAKIQSPILIASIFLAFLIGSFFLLHRMTSTYGFANGSFAQALIAGSAATVMLTLIWIQTPILDGVWHFGPLIQTAFGEPYRLWLTLGSLLLVAFVSS
jgi:hypothetical protein